MSKKLVLLLLVLIALVVLSSMYVIVGMQAYSRYQRDSLATQEHCGGQSPAHICVHVPSAIFSAFYPFYLASQHPLVSVEYKSSSPLTLVIEVSITRFSQQQAQTVNATSSSQSQAFIPPLQDQALQKLTAEEVTSLHVQVTDTRGHLYYVDDVPLLLHSRWMMQWAAANRLQIAAWVMPNDPTVADLVTKAAAHLPDQSPPAPPAMIGYHSASRQQVIDQIDAIYDTLRLDYHIQYVQASIPYNGTGTGDSATEIVKLPAEVLQQRSGMCVELTALLASAVEKIGLRPEIIIIPGHAFLGVAVSQDAQQYEYWDAVDMNNNVAADSANVQADRLYTMNVQQHTIVDTIVVSKARSERVGPMF